MNSWSDSGSPNAGIIYFRLESVDIALRIARLESLLDGHGNDLRRFFIVTESEVRIRDA